MRAVKGFTLLVALLLIGAAIMAQPILLEINTNFIAHKLEPTKGFAPKNIGVRLPKMSLKLNVGISKIAPLILVPEKSYMSFEVFSFPRKNYGLRINKIERAKLVLPEEWRYKGAVKYLSVMPKFALNFPEIRPLHLVASLKKIHRTFKGVKVENLNISKGIYLSVLLYRRKEVNISSLKVLEMKKKLTAYSPLGGLETIGKFMKESKYAFWTTPKKFGMEIDTPLISNWIVYDYTEKRVNNFSSSFNMGPFSTLISMKEGNVKGDVRTLSGISFGTEVSSSSTVSLFAEVPVSFGKFGVIVGGKYVMSSPTKFEPNITLKYDMEKFSPYIFYNSEDSTPVVGAGLIANTFLVSAGVSLSATPTASLLMQYFSPIGIIGMGAGLKNNLYSADVRLSSKPFGFNFVQFSLDGSAYMDSKGAYGVLTTLNMDFRFFSSYVQGWMSMKFYKNSPQYSYGVEVSF